MGWPCNGAEEEEEGRREGDRRSRSRRGKLERLEK